MLTSRPGLGLKAIQDHFLEALVLVLVLECLVLETTIQDHGWIMPYWYYGNDDDYISKGCCLLSTLH